MDSVDNLMANTRNNPIEELDLRFPMRCDQYELRHEPAAPGQWRGGIGIIRRNRFLVDGILLVRGRPPDRPAARDLRRLGRPRRLVPQEPRHGARGDPACEGHRHPVRRGRVHRVPGAERGRATATRSSATAGRGSRGRARRLHDPRARPRCLRRRLRRRADARDRRGRDRGASGELGSTRTVTSLTAYFAGRDCRRRRAGLRRGQRRVRDVLSEDGTSGQAAPLRRVEGLRADRRPAPRADPRGRAGRAGGSRPRRSSRSEFGVSRADRARGAAAARRAGARPDGEGAGGRQLRRTLPDLDHLSDSLSSSISLLADAHDVTSRSSSRPASCSRYPRRGSPPRRREHDVERLRATIPPDFQPRHAGGVRLQPGLPLDLIDACENPLLLIAAQPVFSVLQTQPRALDARATSTARSTRTTADRRRDRGRRRRRGRRRCTTISRSSPRTTSRRGASPLRLTRPGEGGREAAARRCARPRVEQFGAGPWATLQFADLGAEVVKIEDPATAATSAATCPRSRRARTRSSSRRSTASKKSVSLDLRHAAAREVFHDLVRAPDAVSSNLRGDLPAKLGLRTRPRDVNPRIVCCSLSGFGMTGPRASEGGYDYMMQGLAGWMSLTGEPAAADEERPLARRPLRRLCRGDRDPGGHLARPPRRRRLRLRHLAVRDRASRADVRRDLDRVPRLHAAARRNSAHPSHRPVPELRAADGWIVVGAAKEKFWQRLCEAIGRPELAGDERSPRSPPDREPRRALPSWTRPSGAAPTSGSTRSCRRRAGVAVNDVAAALEDPQVRRASDRRVRPPRARRVRSIATPLRLTDGETVPGTAGRAGAVPAASTPGLCWSSSAATRGSASAELADRRCLSAHRCHLAEARLPDLVGYGENPPDPCWPEGKRVALNLVLNYEEGGESTPLAGRSGLRGVPPRGGRRAAAMVGRLTLNTQSMFEFGSRAGFWRVHRVADVVRCAADGVRCWLRPGAEPGGRSRDDRSRLGGREPRLALDRMDGELSEDEERDPLHVFGRDDRVVLAARPVGWYTGRVPGDARASSWRPASSSTTRTRTPTSCPTGSRWRREHLVVPYTLDANGSTSLFASSVYGIDEVLLGRRRRPSRAARPSTRPSRRGTRLPPRPGAASLSVPRPVYQPTGRTPHTRSIASTERACAPLLVLGEPP